MNKSLKFGIILLISLCVILLLIMSLENPLRNIVIGRSNQITDETQTPIDEDTELVRAVEKALAQPKGRWAEFTYKIDHIQVQDGGQMAIVWLAPVDPETGTFLGREPELALAERDQQGNWQVLLEGEENFNEKFLSCQDAEKNIEGDLIPDDQTKSVSGQVLGGYYLPWAAGLEKRLTWSVGHTSCYPIYYCTHAFDFADGTMFPIVASKGGTVFHWYDGCTNGDPNCSNSITLLDRSTTPWTYQIYLHIAYDSVPDWLKEVGTPVMQGQYIANVDDTGYSTGHHVHFMVVSENTRYFSYSLNSIWGVAEDITFRDVDINWDAATQGGRPRLAYEAATYGGVGRTYYISGNQPANPPTGGLTAPQTKTVVKTTDLTVKGWGKDDVAVTKFEFLAFVGDEWITVGEAPGGESFSASVDLCASDLPDGPFYLALRVWDYEGNPSTIRSMRKLIKDVECGQEGSDPRVTLTLKDDVLALPQAGLINATAVPGKDGHAVQSVEFWLHGLDWQRNKWVYLGKDTNPLNGWQAHITTRKMRESDKYTLVAVATDAEGNQDADINLHVIVDHTDPWVNMTQIPSPYSGRTIRFRWTGGDQLSGLDHYSVGMYVNGGNYQLLANYLPKSVSSYPITIKKGEIVRFEVTAYDQSGNNFTNSMSVYREGYEFPYNYIFPVFYSDEAD